MSESSQPELSTSGRWGKVDQVVLAFEAAWRDRPRPDIAGFLEGAGAWRGLLLRELVQVDLERRVKAGEAVRIEDRYLASFPELAEDEETLLSLLAREFHLRRLGEPGLAAEEYFSRFPRLAERLRPLLVPATLPGTGAQGDTPALATFVGSNPRERRARMAPGRFELLEVLGRGGMGVVYKARDRRTGQVVALKEMRQVSPEALYRFKKEFRSRADRTHENLVSLYELFAEGDEWYFTMELVEGVDFTSYVRHGHDRHAVRSSPRPADAAAIERLRGALRQLAAGVAAIHEAGQMHRDLKPGNVLVAAAGRVVVLDFGLVAELDRSSSLNSTEGRLLGTVPYMAPEQAAGRSLTPAADWYSVGVILYESLTGRLPFDGNAYEVLQAKQNNDPRPPQEHVPDVPDDLTSLCMQLLSRDPTQRPVGEEIFRGLEYRPLEKITAPPVRRAESLLVGREPHLAALADAFAEVRRGTPVVVLLSGHSGAGKSALAQRFLDGIRKSGAVMILEGQCFEQESVPYKAFDGVVDALSRQLGRLTLTERDAVLPRDVASLLRIFPVLHRVIEARRECEIADVQEVRRRAFAGLRELLARLGDRQTLVLCIDDLQWGDADSAALLKELLQPPDPPILLLLGCYRSEEPEAGPFLRKLADLRRQMESAIAWRELAVNALTAHEARALAVCLLGTREAAGTEGELIARESGGNPFFIHELTRAALHSDGRLNVSLSLDRFLWERIQSLPEGIRDLLTVIATAVRPIGRVAACQAAVQGSDTLAALAELRSQRLVRGVGAEEEDILAPYHDRVRETVGARLAPALSRDVHRRLAHTLEAAGRADPETLAVHFHGAGDAQRAAGYYARAADMAVDALAFDQAARLFRQALELSPGGAEHEQMLRTKLGDALANAGRGAEAAKAYLAASAGTSHDALVELQRRAAHQYLISGHVDQGIAIATGILRKIGVKLPATPRRVAFSLIMYRSFLLLRGTEFYQRQVWEIARDELSKVDVSWGIAIGLTAIDPIRGAYLQARNLLLALRIGEPYRIARALALGALHSSTAGTSAANSTRRTLLAAGSLARIADNRHALGMVLLASGAAAFCEGRWRDSLSNSQEAESVFREHCVGTYWETNTSQMFALYSRFYLGDFREMVQFYPNAMREARDRGDLYSLANYGTFARPRARMISDRPELGLVELTELAKEWSQDRFPIQCSNTHILCAELYLYCGENSVALQHATANQELVGRSLLSRFQHFRILTLDMAARTLLSVARESSNPDEMLHSVERRARQLEREKRPDCNAMACLFRAAVAMHRRQAEAAEPLLEQAIQLFEAAEMEANVAAARRRLGQIVGGDRGSELVDAADAWMSGQGVCNPARMTRVFAPGFPD
jgi:eukaryotic-like serine/threonine-protein kinase